MAKIELSDDAETLLQRILDKRFRPGIKLRAVHESMVEHLIIEEARRLKVTDDFATKGCSRSQTSVSADQDLEENE